MATAVRTRAPAAGRPSRGAALLRALVAAPAVVGSLLLLLLLSGPLQGWHIVVLLCWPAAGAILLTRPGERLALRLGVGFRRPTAAQAAALNRPMAAALRRTGTAAGDIDLYVQRSPQVNAYTAGRRSLAVTTGTLEQLLAHRLTDDQMIAVLVHELGHHAGCAPHAGLVTAWLSAPWRLATHALLRIAGGLAGRQPRPLRAVVACIGVGLTVARALAQQNWAVAGVLGGVATLAVLCPMANAALARNDEMSADRYAADHGLARPLAATLGALHDGDQAVRGWSRLLASHPPVDRRIDALLAAADRAPVEAVQAHPSANRRGR